ncbi:hypothetical protein KM043_006107 [Ampulex compressa]|nr:hypothetical protein KM043_006107 [Ampulex compressa]
MLTRRREASPEEARATLAAKVGPVWSIGNGQLEEVGRREDASPLAGSRRPFGENRGEEARGKTCAQLFGEIEDEWSVLSGGGRSTPPPLSRTARALSRALGSSWKSSTTLSTYARGGWPFEAKSFLFRAGIASKHLLARTFFLRQGCRQRRRVCVRAYNWHCRAPRPGPPGAAGAGCAIGRAGGRTGGTKMRLI